MITIENIDRIVNKRLDKKNYFVESITEQIRTCPITGAVSNPTYDIIISNLRNVLVITLDREATNRRGYKLVGQSGKVAYLSIKQLQNIDIVLDKIRYVGI